MYRGGWFWWQCVSWGVKNFQEDFNGKEFPYDTQAWCHKPGMKSLNKGHLERFGTNFCESGNLVCSLNMHREFCQTMPPHHKPLKALHIRLASASYMIDEVQLVPMAAGNISDPGGRAFDKSDWTFLSHSLTTFNESTGSLQKSRAQFELQVLRDASPYWSSTIFPEIMIVVLSYTDACAEHNMIFQRDILWIMHMANNLIIYMTYVIHRRFRMISADIG